MRLTATKRSAGAEGDPVNLAMRRTVTFWNRVIIMVSTPGVKGVSRIEAAFEEGDQRRRWCPCPDCGHMQTLRWSQVWWPKGLPHEARYTCESCGSVWTDAERIAAVRAGEWRAEAEFTGVVSYHVPGLLSPFIPLEDAVREFLEAKGNPARLQTWVNTYLGETWEERGERLDASDLAARGEDWEDELPEGVTLLTAGVDVQDDRIECEVVGWGDEHASWSIDYRVFWGDPTAEAVWLELSEYLRRTWEHPTFGDMILRATCLDSGYNTQQCYAFAKKHMRVFPIKGIAGDGKPVIGKPSKNNLQKVQVFPVGTMEAKTLVVARLKAKPGEGGYCSFPADRDIEYFRQLTAESLVTRYHKGFARKEWVKDRPRNEAFDCRVYATAAVELLDVDPRTVRRQAKADWAKRQTAKVTEERVGGAGEHGAARVARATNTPSIAARIAAAKRERYRP